VKTAAVESGCLLGDTRSSVVGLGAGTRLRRRRQVLKRRHLKQLLLHNRIMHRIDA